MITREEAVDFCSVVTPLDKNPLHIARIKHLQEANVLKLRRTPEKKKRVFGYEQKPFKDPKLEKKRKSVCGKRFMMTERGSIMNVSKWKTRS